MTKAISLQIAPLDQGGHAILLALRADAFVELYGGNPQPGVMILPNEAREFAALILFLAEKIERGEAP